MRIRISKVAATFVLAAGLALPAASFAQVATNPGVSIPVHPGTAAPARHAKVDCGQVMSELGGGKKPKEVAESMKISVSSVYRCRKREKLAEAKEKKPGGAPSAAASPTKSK